MENSLEIHSENYRERGTSTQFPASFFDAATSFPGATIQISAQNINNFYLD